MDVQFRTLKNLKMKKFNINLVVVLLSLVTIVSCKKEDPKPEPQPAVPTGSAEIVLEHEWGMSGLPFQLNTALTHPMTGDDLTFETFKYYISNFKLKKSDGTWWTHPNSYFLVDLSTPSSTTLSLNNIPIGDYTEMSYVLGVDSTRNVSGSQSGALSTTNNMFWSWNSGYIMVKAEGTSPQAGSGSFAYHLGGFAGVNKIVTTKSAVFSVENLTVTETSNGKVYLTLNPARLFHTFGSVSNGNIHMPGANAVTMSSDFYGNAFFDRVEN